MKKILLVGLISLGITMSTIGCDTLMVSGAFDDLANKMKKDADVVEMSIDQQLDNLINYRFEIERLYDSGVMQEAEYIANIHVADKAKELYADDKDFTDLLDSLKRTVDRYKK